MGLKNITSGSKFKIFRNASGDPMIYVMLPAYNEEKGLEKVLSALQSLAPELPGPLRVVVIDDGSKDRTREVAQSFSNKLDLKIIKFDTNQGVTEVFKKGLSFIVGDSWSPEKDICVVLDSDNTQNPRVTLDLVNKIQEGSDIVIASRFEGNGKMEGCPLPRLVFSLGVAWLMRLIVHLPNVKDYSIFYRAYRISILKTGFERYGDRLIEGKGFAAVCSLLIKLGNITNRISEVPLVLQYQLKEGTSGMKILKTIRGYLELICDYIASDRFRKMERPQMVDAGKR